MAPTDQNNQMFLANLFRKSTGPYPKKFFEKISVANIRRSKGRFCNPSSSERGYRNSPLNLSVSIFSVINRKDIDYFFVLIDNIEKPELADAVSPCIGRVTLKLLDVIPPKRFCFDLGVNKGIKFLLQESGVASRQFLELL